MEGPGDIVGPIGTLVGLGVVAYGAKKVIDITADTTKKPRQVRRTTIKKSTRPVRRRSVGFDTEEKIRRILG